MFLQIYRMDSIEALVIMNTATVAVTVAGLPIGHTTIHVVALQPPAGVAAAGGVHLGGGVVPYVPPPQAAAIPPGGVHFGGGVVPYVPPPPPPPPPAPIPTHAVPDDGTMIGITAEVSLILFSVISDLFICRIRMWCHTWKIIASNKVVFSSVSE
jgi:hypothetical protein